jgi:hypothetical protein
MHIVLGTPMYGGQCTGAYAASRGALDRSLLRDGSRLTCIDIGNESLIGRARDAIAWAFLNRPELADASHLLFVDADQGFRVPDVARMVAAGKPIIVAPVPLKAIDWERVARAAKAGVPAAELHRYSGHFNVVHVDAPDAHGAAKLAAVPEGPRGPRPIRLDEPFEIKWGGAGLMLIERHVLETLEPSAPEYVNCLPGDYLPKGARIRQFFPSPVEAGDLLSEDYALCAAWRRTGGSVWAAPWAHVEHVGTYTFAGSWADSARLDHQLALAERAANPASALRPEEAA